MAEPESEYLFIDGGYLRGVLEQFSFRYFGGLLDRPEMSEVFCGFRKSFYYDCVPERGEGEREEDYLRRVAPQEAFLDRIQSNRGVHVFEGVMRGDKKNRRQKRIDVAIAVHMLTHSHRRNMERATLLAGDQDFLPLAEALVQDGLYLTLWFEATSAAPELVAAVDARRIIDLGSIWDLLPSEVLQRYPRPYWHQGSSPMSNIVRTGTDSLSRTVVVRKEGDSFMAAAVTRQGVTNVLTCAYADLDFLVKYLEFVHPGLKWEEGYRDGS